MFGHPNLREVDRRLRLIEKGPGKRASSTAVGTADHVTETVASVLANLADRFRGVSIRDEAAKFGGDTARIGNDALRRLSEEVEHRPIAALAVAFGVGFLASLVILRRKRAWLKRSAKTEELK
jgi:hypothetical protein